ncbi:MAG TPA: aldo/keto reductase [bacterium]|nr:aldo/keto reductase [bacterium]
MPFATPDATARYTHKFSDLQKAGFYRPFNGLSISSLGLGTYLGNPNEADDKLYVEAIKTALISGINLLDSAINYRCMRSERNIGQALRELVAEGKLAREEVVVCTKGGFIPFDGQTPSDPAGYFQKTYIGPGICGEEDVVADCHCMTPRYLRDQVERSLKNLGVDTLDLFYIHNPETQFEEVELKGFYFRLEAAFRELEALVKEGMIAAYGTATWNGYRVAPGSPGFLSLNEVLKAAEKAGGSTHHFKAVQLPYNLGMAEAYGLENQVLGSQTVPFLEAAKANGIAVFTSASILQSRLSRNLPPSVAEAFPGLSTDAQRAIQFVRSTPGVTCALVGMKRKAHVQENLKVGFQPPATDKVASFFS